MPLKNNTSASSVGALASPVAMGMNLGIYDYWTSSIPFANLIHGTTYGWSGTGAPSVDALGWITAMPNGQSVSKIVLANMDYPGGYVKSGRYAVTWSGLLTVSVSGLMTNIITTDHRIEFDMPMLGSGNTHGAFLYVVVTNSSGSAASVNDIRVYHKDDEAALLAGEIFQAEFIANLRGADVLRFMDWMNTNSSTIINFSDIPTEANCSWVPVPISIIGKLAAKTNKNIWVCIPHQATQACMNAIAQALYAQIGNGSQKIYVEYSNETWNIAGGFNQGAWIQNTKSVGLTIVDINGAASSANNDKLACASAHGAMQGWTAMELYFPRARVIRVFAGQAAWWAYLAAGFEYADTSLTLYGGAKVKMSVDAYAVAPYFSIAGGKYGIPSDMSFLAQITRQDQLLADNYWDNVMQASLDEYGGYVLAAKNGSAGKRADIKLVSYELGQGFGVSLGQSTMWSATVDAVNNALDFGVDITGRFIDGDSLVFAWNGGIALLPGATWWMPYKIKLLGTTKLQVFAQPSDYPATPATLNITGGTWYIMNNTRLQALVQRYQTLLDGPRGVDWYAKSLALYSSLGLSLYLHYHSMAGYIVIGAGGSNWFQWGLKRSPWESDAAYPRAAWFRRFANGT